MTFPHTKEETVEHPSFQTTCPVCDKGPGEFCWSKVVLRSTGQPFGTLPVPHFFRVFPDWPR